jgi:hypothetical protein
MLDGHTGGRWGHDAGQEATNSAAFNLISDLPGDFRIDSKVFLDNEHVEYIAWVPAGSSGQRLDLCGHRQEVHGCLLGLVEAHVGHSLFVRRVTVSNFVVSSCTLVQDVYIRTNIILSSLSNRKSSCPRCHDQPNAMRNLNTMSHMQI